MRRFVCLLAGVLLVVPSLGSDDPKGYDGAVVWDDALQGEWRHVGYMLNGNVIKEEGGVWTYRNGKETISQDGRQLSERRYVVHPSSRLGRMDCVETSGKTWRSIYRIEGDNLLMSSGPLGGERPRSLEDKNLWVFVFKRVK